MLAACAPERHRQARKAVTLVCTDAGIHQRRGAGEKIMHALLLIEIVDHWCVFARKSLERFFAPGIRYVTGIENESPAVPRLVPRYTPSIRKTEDSHRQSVFVGSNGILIFSY